MDSTASRQICFILPVHLATAHLLAFHPDSNNLGLLLAGSSASSHPHHAVLLVLVLGLLPLHVGGLAVLVAAPRHDGDDRDAGLLLLLFLLVNIVAPGQQQVRLEGLVGADAVLREIGKGGGFSGGAHACFPTQRRDGDAGQGQGGMIIL